MVYACIFMLVYLLFPASILLSEARRTRTAWTWAWLAPSTSCRTSRCPLSQSPAWTGAPTNRGCACAQASTSPSASSSSPNSTQCENVDVGDRGLYSWTLLICTCSVQVTALFFLNQIVYGLGDESFFLQIHKDGDLNFVCLNYFVAAWWPDNHLT